MTQCGKQEIVQRMKTKGFDDINITQLQLLAQQCEVALYTPVINEAEMQAVYDLAEDLIDNLSKV